MSTQTRDSTLLLLQATVLWSLWTAENSSRGATQKLNVLCAIANNLPKKMACWRTEQEEGMGLQIPWGFPAFPPHRLSGRCALQTPQARTRRYGDQEVRGYDPSERTWWVMRCYVRHRAFRSVETLFSAHNYDLLSRQQPEKDQSVELDPSMRVKPANQSCRCIDTLRSS